MQKAEQAVGCAAPPVERWGASGYAIEARGLVRRFGSIEAISNVSLSIRKGEFFSLLGPSGCGKTTLLRLIAGLDSPDAGTLVIAGRDARGIPPHKRPVNTVFQSYALFPHLNVRDNIAFGLRMKGVPAGDISQRVERVMGLAQISDLGGRRPSELSGGQKQRVALARAVVNEPDVLLLDEPLGALDLKLRKQLQIELHQLQRRLGITFIYVTHDQEEALVMSDRIAVMNAGKIEQLDDAEPLYERPRTQFVAQFLGSCNLFEGSVSDLRDGEAVVETTLGPLRITLHASARRPALQDHVTLAIRPEKVRLLKLDGAPIQNQVTAQIEDVVFGGADTRYRLRAANCPIEAVALNCRSGHQGFHLGETVVCELCPDCLLLLEEHRHSSPSQQL